MRSGFRFVEFECDLGVRVLSLSVIWRMSVVLKFIPPNLFNEGTMHAHHTKFSAVLALSKLFYGASSAKD